MPFRKIFRNKAMNAATQAFKQLHDRNPFNDFAARRTLSKASKFLSPRDMNRAYHRASMQMNFSNRAMPGFFNDPYPFAPGRCPFHFGPPCFPRFF